MLSTLEFEGQEIHSLTWKGKTCWIAVEVARAAGVQNPSRAVNLFIKSTSWLEEGKDYEILRGKVFDELVKSGLISLSDITSISPKSKHLTLFYESGLTGFVSTRRTETGKRLNQWLHREVLPSIRKTGQYNIYTGDDHEYIEHARRELQLAMSKDLAKFLFPVYGKKALIVYYALTAKGFTGKNPSDLVKWAKKHGVPSKVYKRGGREVIRYVLPHIGPCISVQDKLVVEKNYSPYDAHNRARLLLPFFEQLEKDGKLNQACIVDKGEQNIFSAKLNPPKKIPNPFKEKLKGI